MPTGGEARRRCLTIPLIVISYLLFPTPSKSDEIDDLLQIKHSLTQDSYDAFTTWNEGASPCTFTGVSCDSNGHVAEINLSETGLHGVLPFDAICRLSSLKVLSMGYNSLNGMISSSLKNCTSLEVLDLGNNFFTGEVPGISALKNLKLLSLNNSGVSGSFPWYSLRNLTSLTFLSLGDNFFNQTDAFPDELGGLTKLYWLYLSNCSIKGRVPESLTNLTLLENLELASNMLFGAIPSGIGKLANLWQLELYSNSLTGKLPEGFRNLTNLVNFDASTNNLVGDLAVLKPLNKLVSLQLFENQFTGEIPVEFGQFKYLEEFSVYRNILTGALPQELGSWSDFQFIDASENLLSGAIPPDMCKNGKMTDLLILQNKFTGSIPETYANCKSLVRFRVNNNSLSGIVPPGLWSLPNVLIFDLSMNMFEGPLTSDIGNARSLALLLLDKNKFSGDLPSAISQASSLTSIRLSSNGFSGEIPETIRKLRKLSSLILDRNKFSGTIPESIGSCYALYEINLSGNNFSGKIPKSIGSLPSLNSLNLSNNELCGQIPYSLSSLRLSNLDLSNNRLTGLIPEALSIEVFRSGFHGNPGLCSRNLQKFQPCSFNSRRSRHRLVFLTSFSAGMLALVICSVCLMIQKFRQNVNKRKKTYECSWSMESYRMAQFSERDIIDGIKHEHLIGKGGSGNVYRVVLRNGHTLAVKHIWTSNSYTSKSSSTSLVRKNPRSEEYEAEVAALSAVRHINVVKLYCSITSEDSDFLVYEYLPNGSLWDRLHSAHKFEMGWEVRYAIAVGAARGLDYLHHGFDRPVIHRDVKSSNILLDEDWRPRIADFGLAKIVQSGSRGETLTIAGTLGYMAPEYAFTSKITEKSDVYSFGVVLLELVTGKRPIEPDFGDSKDIVNWVCSKVNNGDDAVHLVDSSISETQKFDAAKVLGIAILCTGKIPALRPSMKTVVHKLEQADPCSRSAVVLVEKDGESSRSQKLQKHCLHQ